METPEERKSKLPKLEEDQRIKKKKGKSNKKYYIDNNGKKRKIGSWGRVRNPAVRAWARNQENAILAGVEKKIGKAGHVYIFSLGHDNLYKIGFSYNIQQRLNSLKAANPLMKCVWSIWTKDMREMEKKIHAHCQNNRIDREIFKLSQGQIIDINSMANKYNEVINK